MAPFDFRLAPDLGALPEDGGTRFRVWTTTAMRVAVELYDPATGRPLDRRPLHALGGGLYELFDASVGTGSLYRFVLDERVLPDPYARFLPRGVHGPAEVVANDHAWRSPRPSTRCDVVYELHVGTFSREGTFRAAAERLPELVDLGVDTLELMPISSFPGARGWGYDGVAHFAPYAGYGTPADLAEFVDGAHALGLRVLLDVVYNHFGPDGNYLASYSPEYFTNDVRTPWGDGPNFRSPFMRALAIRNALYWLTELRFDGLRLDALHAIQDPSETHVLEELSQAVRASCEGAILIGEDERNLADLVRSRSLDALWADDLHHQIRVLIAGDREGYYDAYRRDARDLARIITNGWLYEGQVYPPTGKPRGTPALDLPREAFVYCLENHDQVGNRPFGDRLTRDAGVDAFLGASALLLFLPQRVLLFMGQEWAASTPFLYFTDHAPALGELVSRGRREEFGSFAAFRDARVRESIPDPQDSDTFESSKLVWAERGAEPHASVLALYRAMLALRRSDLVLSSRTGELFAEVDDGLLMVTRTVGDGSRVLRWNLSGRPAPLSSGEADAGELVLTTDRHFPARGVLGPGHAAISAFHPARPR